MTPRPDVSFVMPCYNEEAIVGYTIRQLQTAFSRAGHRLELIAVDNGSTDSTGAVIGELAAQNPLVRPVRVERNEGYGYGVLAGLPLCSAPWVGIIPADGQVDAEDVVKLFEAVVATKGTAVAKVRRRFRMDGLTRTLVSTLYNLFVRLLWPRLASIDVNGTPKILPRAVVERMHLQSKGWLLDPEILIKAHYMGLRILEFNVFARMRGGGLSHVRPSTCWEFFRQLLVFRFSRRMSEWRRSHVGPNQTIGDGEASPPASGAGSGVGSLKGRTVRPSTAAHD
jgi:glycosyltransferase involved in cell wall biosynthesis